MMHDGMQECESYEVIMGTREWEAEKQQLCLGAHIELLRTETKLLCKYKGL
jgi:hypothetical protein